MARRNPKTAKEHQNRSDMPAIGGNWDATLADLNEAVHLDPNDASAWHGGGIAWREKGKPDKALDDFDEALRLDPDDQDAAHNRPLVLSAVGAKKNPPTKKRIK